LDERQDFIMYAFESDVKP